MALLGPVCDIRVAAQQATPDLREFTGTWLENPSKSRGTISKDLTYTFSQDPDGFITIVRGRVLLRDRVRFDGNDYPTPDIAGRTTSWTRVNSTLYETTIKNNGALTARGKWTLSENGKRLTQETTRAEPNAATNLIEYVRKSGDGTSLIGVWEPVASRTSVPDTFVITMVDATTLKVQFPRTGASYTMTPDGQPQIARSDALPGMTAVVVSAGPRALRRTTFRDRKPISEMLWSLSADSKTLTLTNTAAASSTAPAMTVYEKQE